MFVSTMTIFNKLVPFTVKSEGEVKLPNGNHKLYKCPAGKWTMGHGYNVEDNGLPDDIAELLLKRQLNESKEILEANVSCFAELSENRQLVLIDMCFNMGWPKLRGFKKMFAALEKGDYEEAANQMIDSKWFRDVGIRAEKLVATMRTDEWHER